MLLTLTMTLIPMTFVANAAVVIPKVEQFVPTHAYATAAPNPIGVGQTTAIEVWLVEVMPLSVSAETGQAVGTGYTGPTIEGVWSGYRVTVTAPDGTKTSFGPYSASDVGTVTVEYTPTQTGNYSVFFSFAGQTINGTMTYPVTSTHFVWAYYEPSNYTTSFTVQSTPIVALPETPLPTSYWQTPINWQNQNWYSISQNWFGSALQWNATVYQSPTTLNPGCIPPSTAHVMWTRALQGTVAFGGQIGGSMYSGDAYSNYYTGKTYEYPFSTPIIINGVLFYNAPKGVQPQNGYYAVDLATGKQLYFSNDTNEAPTELSVTSGVPSAVAPGEDFPGVIYGEVFSHHNPNEVGGIAYLWGIGGATLDSTTNTVASVISLYDATTGQWILNIKNYPYSATLNTWVTAPDGELLDYVFNDPGSGTGSSTATTGWLACWNSTLCLGAEAWVDNPWTFRPPTGMTLNFKTGVQWNVTIPVYNAPNVYTGLSQPVQYMSVNDGVLLVTTGSTSIPQNYEMEAAYSATTGAFLWDANRSVAQEPAETAWGLYIGASNGVYVEYNKATMQLYGFNILTGAQLWGPTTPLPTADSSYAYQGTVINNLVVLQGMVALYAFNINTGALAWTWSPPPAGLQSPWPNYPLESQTPEIIGVGSGSDAVVIVAGADSHGDQLYRGAAYYAINATNGKLVWQSEGMMQGMAAANGYVVALNEYDMSIYCFGQGPSKTTVSAPGVGVTTATPVTITGSVTDISAGSQQNAVAANFPNGLPCVSDDSMTQFMAAVYQQQPMPTNLTGVPVTISVTDSNHNTYPIGTTTTNPLTGTFGLTWTPIIQGNYTVTATFAGTGGYYGSYATTYFYAGAPAPTAAPTASPPTGLASTGSLMLGVAAIIIVIVIIGVVLAILMLRKRP